MQQYLTRTNFLNMKKAFVLFAIGLVLHGNLSAQISEYIYPKSGSPSYSNYGTTGLIQMPSARFHDSGSLGFLSG